MTLIKVIKLQVPTFTALDILKACEWLVATCSIHHHIRWSLLENVCYAIIERLVNRDRALVVTCGARLHFLDWIFGPLDHAYVTFFVHHLYFAFETVVKLDCLLTLAHA